MSQSEAMQEPIQNAEAVIERFGGIRPMASKTNVPVTTIQGWKKRNVIPGGRRGDIMKAAQTHNIDLSGILEGSSGPANQNSGHKEESRSVPSAAAAPSMFSQPKTQGEKTTESKRANPAPVDESFKKQLSDIEERAVTKSTLITFFLLAVAIIALAVVLWPSAQSGSEAERIRMLEENIKQLEGKLSETEQNQGMLGNLIPQDLDQRIADLQAQAEQAQQQFGAAMEKAQEISNDVLAENAGNLEERLAKLEQHVGEISGSPVMAGLMERFAALQASDTGEGQMDQSVSELGAIFANLQGAGSDQVTSALESARTQSTAINQTFEGVPTQDLKAAALLLGMTQFRSSLSRDNQPFEDDLQLLMSLVGEDDPVLAESLQKLAPKAQEGVLTPGGLATELKSMTGEIVVASLKGEDVSIQEKAQARFNNLLQIEKDGELVTGTPTQDTLVQTENLLNQGDVAGALALMQTLDGPAAMQAQPWIEEAQATLMAEQLKEFLTANMNIRAFGQRAGGTITAGSGAYGNATLIQDEETGINILKQNKSPLGALPSFE
jgi:hypothetical protein